nr:50S ribosomal protein L6 [Candidatus Njordarchaeota archaeon]
MSAIREEIRISPSVSVHIDDNKTSVKGPKGEVQRDFSHITSIEIRKSDDMLTIRPLTNRKKDRSLVVTLKTQINNMILGVTRGFEYKLKVAHSHFPITVRVDKDKRLVHIENFIGERTPRIANIEGNVEIVVKGDDVIVSGADRQAVGQTAANIEKVCRIRDKDPRVFQDGIYLYEVYCGDELLRKI